MASYISNHHFYYVTIHLSSKEKTHNDDMIVKILPAEQLGTHVSSVVFWISIICRALLKLFTQRIIWQIRVALFNDFFVYCVILFFP